MSTDYFSEYSRLFITHIICIFWLYPMPIMFASFNIWVVVLSNLVFFCKPNLHMSSYTGCPINFATFEIAVPLTKFGFLKSIKWNRYSNNERFVMMCENLPNLSENLQKLVLKSCVIFKILVNLEQFTMSFL